MREEERIEKGLLFCPGNPDLVAIKRKTHKLNQDYNRLYEDQTAEREAILREMLGGIGEKTFLQGPITFHYGTHTTIGHHCFINFNFTVQDDAKVVIGDHCDFGPNITIVTPVHPMLPDERLRMRCADGEIRRLCYAKPVTIGSYCWLGANVVICPGVTIGDNCVIGAGSVVTKSIPANSFAAGNPCRVIREITEADSMRHKPEILADCAVIEEEP
ncbi:MAG: sugar O-acetyltransferase [Clostridia bacterium]|nr:sugar O-acetyltransferase [Clostridia bacterium]